MVKGSMKGLLFSNPFLKAGLRGSAKMMRSMAGSKAGTMITILAAIPILIIVSGSFLFGGSAVGESTIFIFMTGAFLLYLAVPPIFYNSVAGERERGSWELLRVAPVSTVQILVGKFVAGILVLLPLYIFIGGAAFLTSFDSSAPSYLFSGRNHVTALEVLASCLILGSLGFFIAALTIFLSARMKRPFSALMASYGILAILTILIPFVLSLTSVGDQFVTAQYWDLLPFSQLSNLFYVGGDRYDGVGPPMAVHWTIYCLLHCGAAFLLLAWAAFTLDFPDLNPKFLPKKKDS